LECLLMLSLSWVPMQFTIINYYDTYHYYCAHKPFQKSSSGEMMSISWRQNQNRKPESEPIYLLDLIVMSNPIHGKWRGGGKKMRWSMMSSSSPSIHSHSLIPEEECKKSAYTLLVKNYEWV
jgi:hypothetical protein